MQCHSVGVLMQHVDKVPVTDGFLYINVLPTVVCVNFAPKLMLNYCAHLFA